jgi:hypothetical protein
MRGGTPLASPGALSYVLRDADLSRKERGHRGVRPRHPDTDGPPGQAEEGSSSGSVRVAFVNRRGSARYDLWAATPGTTGFDVVGSWGWSRVEVPGGLVNHPEKPYVRTLTSTPSSPSKH